MKRQIISIDEEKCNGCGVCVTACHEGAIALVAGKAKLVRDDYCDGLGNCLPACPTGAISFEEREAAAYDEELVKQNQGTKKLAFKPVAGHSVPAGSGCPGSRAQTFAKKSEEEPGPTDRAGTVSPASELRQWPVQIKLVPVEASFFDGANLLIAADCSAFAYASFHQDFIRNHITMIGCPKLDSGDYTEKLTAILERNDIKSLTIVRMEVPCCGGLARVATDALKASGKFLPWQIVTISSDGKRL
jgi:NAD-dependent dihydropyrimidine dehydrogenase PreA subunit